MSTNDTRLRGSWVERFFWGFSFKNRKFLIPMFLLLIAIGSVILARNYMAMDIKLKKLSRYEPIYVLGVAKSLNIGDVVKIEDLKPMLFYKREFEKLSYKDTETELDVPSMIRCNYDPVDDKLTGFKDIIGRVVNIPIHANSFLRREYLAPIGTVPGLMNLLAKNHSLVDVEVPQVGFNTYIKPNDQVDLHQLGRSGSRLIASKVKVILVDSEALGSAPLQVEVNSRKIRHLTLSIPEENFARVARAKKNKTLVVTYKNKEPEVVFSDYVATKPKPMVLARAPRKVFQTLTMITGARREILTR